MKKTLAILAGQGPLPQLIAKTAQASYERVIMIGFAGITPAETLSGASASHTVGLAKVGRLYKILQDEAVSDVCLIGKLRRPSLTQLIPDLRGAKLLTKLAGIKGDNALLRTIASDIEGEGFHIVGAAQIAPDKVAGEGLIAGKPPKGFDEDIAHGLQVARTLGQLDVGQAVVVQQGLVLGVEGIEGTDALINRCAALQREGRPPILVKTAKPQQDLRLDMPVVGDTTLAACQAAGFAGIAVEAGRVFLNVTLTPRRLWLWGVA